MISPEVYADALSILTTAPLTWQGDDGTTTAVEVRERDMPEPRAARPQAPCVVIFTAYGTDLIPAEYPLGAPWQAAGVVALQVLVPLRLERLAVTRNGIVRRLSDLYRLATLRAGLPLGIIYGRQSASGPDADDSGIYSLTMLNVAWERTELMPTATS